MAVMRILLDAKDLIKVVEHSKPVKLSEFDGWLRTRDAELVYSLVNIRGLAAALDLGSSFLPQIKDYLTVWKACLTVSSLPGSTSWNCSVRWIASRLVRNT
jgi:hypothetical protein